MADTMVYVTSQFEDKTTRKVSVGPINSSHLADVDIKQNIIDFNSATTREREFPGFDVGWVSDNGASFVKFSAAEIVTTQETVIF